MKYLLFTFVLGLGWMCSNAQAKDSTRRKLSIWERRRQEMIHMMEVRQQQVLERQRTMEDMPYRKADSARWVLSLNPFGVLELQGAAGLGVGYYFSRHWQVWLESSGIFQMYQKPAQSCLGGIREILAVKYYFGWRESLFFAGEFRYKDVFFHDVDNFINNVDTAVVSSYTYKIEDIVFGGAVWFGGRINLTSNHRLRLEPSIGLGFKGRTVVWHDVPHTYTYQKPRYDQIDLLPNPVRTPERLTVYLPATVRLVYAL